MNPNSEKSYPKEKKLRVVTYSRVSTSHHDQKPEIQVEELRRFCDAREWKVTEEIIDHGYSGGTENRPGLKRLFTLVRERRVDAIVVTKLDRLFRSLRHLVATLEETSALGVTFVATRDNVDWSTPGGRLFVQILGSLAEFEKALLVERTLMGLAHARSRGKRLGRPPRGLERDIIRLRRKGKTYREIQRSLRVSAGNIRRALFAAPQTPSSEANESSINSRSEHE